MQNGHSKEQAPDSRGAVIANGSVVQPAEHVPEEFLQTPPEKGLKSSEAAERLSRFGRNEVPAKDRRTAPQILLSQFSSPLILILVAASIIAFVLGEQIDAAIILAIVVLNALLGFYQEFKSEKALSELKKYISFTAEVLRDGVKCEVNVAELVPGDIIFLGIGDIVPADTRIIRADEFSTNDAVVTGESAPLQKGIGNLAFMGTVVSSGSCTGIVVATGKGTLFGRTATVLSAKEPPTDFQKNIRNFGNFLLKVILVLTVLVFIFNTLLGKPILDSFLFALALAVGITPELLPVIITISLSGGAISLAKKKVVVKRLAAIEDLGNMDTLCMDKTGTLTENKVTLEEYTDVDGNASPQLLEFALLCNSAVIENGVAKGKAIDAAIWQYAGEKGKAIIKGWAEVDEIPFDYERRRMSVISSKGGKTFLICKGAPESVLSACTYVLKGGRTEPIAKHRRALDEKFKTFGSRGFTSIALAFREVKNKENYSHTDENGLVFAGFLAFLDPPKKTASHALEAFRNLGIELKLLTGDNAEVALEVCREVGLRIKGRVISGAELGGMKEEDFLRAAEENNIFVRITPEQKFAIVNALGKKGHIVGFMGDGVNDAPALRAADVGITVDSAVDVAKGSAEIVLLEGDLSVLADGIKGGRKTFGNITKYIFNTVSANFGNMFTLAVSSLFLKFIPLLPSQILLANFISDVPLMTISADNVDEDYLQKPKRWSIKAISRFMLFFGAISAVFDFITIALLMFVLKADPASFRTAWFLESVLSEIIVTFAIRTKRNFWQSSPAPLLVYSSIAAMALTIALIYSPLAPLFAFDQLAVPILAAIGLILLAYFALAEFAKKRFYEKYTA